MGIALSAAFILPDLPHNTRGFTKEELELAQLRMTEDVGESDTDSEEQGAFEGLGMALKDSKIYILMFTLTAYVVGLSFNAFFVRSPCHSLYYLQVLTHVAAYSYPNTWLRICADSAHECTTVGVFLHLLSYSCLEL